MKKILSIVIIAVLMLSTFSILSPQVKSSSGVAPEVVCVPFHGELAGVPHDAWIGKEIILKGTAHDEDGDSTMVAYKWDFGDGYSTDWISGVNPYIIEAKHTYTGTMADGTPYEVGKYFTAWLHVRDADGLVGQDSYFIAIRDKTLDVEVNVAIDDGLWWLHKQAYRYTSGGINYARWSSVSSYYTSATAESVLAFEIQGHQPIGNLDEDPYVETVQRGLTYVFSKTRVIDISAWGPGTSSPYGDPDTNGNDIGIGVTNNREPYELGMVMMAIAASGDPDLTANTGPTGVVGRAYKDILTDMVDICAWGQNDYGGARGGWRYAWNYGSSDNSVSQWPMMALEAAKTNWGIVVADFVKTELDTYWLTYSQNVDGSFGYSGPGGSNIARTGTGIIGLNYVELPADNPRIANAVNWLGNHWSEFGNYYGMYAVMKGMRTANPEITTVGSHDWYAEYAQYLVNNQQADGGWPNYYGRVLATDWAILILSPTVTKPGPVADAGLDVESYPPTIPLEFDASGSYHLDTTKDIVLYEWDFDSDGTWDYSGIDLIVQHSYPAYYVLAELVKAVIGADYLWGGKGWDLNEKRFVEPHEIKGGYNYWNPNEGKTDFGSGVDCSGLAFWSYNKMVGTTNYEDSILPEGAQGQWEACEKIDKDDLRLGDLLFFDEYPVGDEVMNHVAMYVGPFFYNDEEYNVVHASGFTNTVTPAHYNPENEMLTTTKVTDETQTIDVDGYGRVANAPAPDSIIDWDQTARDYTATLRVTDNSDPALQDTDTCVVHITSPPWKPVAYPDGPYEGYEGAPVHFDGSKSYDPESKMYDSEHPWYETIVEYEWDLDNDGQFDDSKETNPSFTWGTKGTYSIGLKVTDSQPSGPGGTIGPLDFAISYTTVVVKSGQTINVGLIPVETPDESINHGKSYFEDIGKKLHDYFLEVSFGSLNVEVEVYTNPADTWFSVPHTIGWYFTWWAPWRKEQFIKDAISASDNTIDFRRYDYGASDGKGIVAFIPPSWSDGPVIYPNKGKDGRYNTQDGVKVDAIIVPEWRFQDQTKDVRGVAHEFGHALGKLLVTSVAGKSKDCSWVLPDLYKRYHEKKDVVTQRWCLMGDFLNYGIDRVHLCSYSKEWLGWLSYEDAGRGKTYTVDGLVKMNYGDNVLRYTYKKPWWEGAPHFYIMEVRTNSMSHSDWDTQTRYTKVLAFYQVDVRVDFPLCRHDTIDLVRTMTATGSYSDPDAAVTFNVVSITETSAEVKISEYAGKSLKGASLETLADVFSDIRDILFHEQATIPLPDLDLHCYADSGEHIGLNYETGVYEIEIPGAMASGDLLNGREWIFVPEDMNVRFVVNAQDNAEFLEALPNAAEFTDGVESFELSLVYYDSDGNRWESTPAAQQIDPGQTTWYSPAIVENPDGTYTTELTPITWEYVFEDTVRETMLRISTDDKHFQFVAADKEFLVKHDPDMRMTRKAIIIRYEDWEIKIVTVNVDTDLDFCIAVAWDQQTGKRYMLLDKLGIE